MILRLDRTGMYDERKKLYNKDDFFFFAVY